MRSPLLGLFALSMLASTASTQQADTTRKNPFIAGTLSSLLPGVGSLYAGNTRHALIHAGVGVASFVALSANSDNVPIGLGGLLTYVANSLWSIGTAVQDVNDFNRRAGRGETKRRPYGIAHAHLGIGGGRVPYLDNASGGRTSEVRLGLAFNALPEWTVALAESGLGNRASTGYYVPACASGRGCAPRVAVSTRGFEVQRRWWNDRLIHPVVTVGTGSLKTSYDYPATDSIFSSRVQDSVQNRRYVSVGAGLEGNLGSWIHGALIAGYRATSGRTIPRASSSNTGPTLVWLVEIGKP